MATIAKFTVVYTDAAASNKSEVKVWAGGSAAPTLDTALRITGVTLTSSVTGEHVAVMKRGYIRGVTPGGSPVAGDLLWAQADGSVSKTKPTPPTVLVFVGTYIGGSVVHVDMKVFPSLSELSHVKIETPAEFDVMIWDPAEFAFVPRQIDHGADLAGLADDDHPQYILVDGSRPFTGDQSMGGNDLTNILSAELVDKAGATGAAGKSVLWHDSTEEEILVLHEAELIPRRPQANRPRSNSRFDDFLGSSLGLSVGNAFGFGDGASANFFTESAAGTVAVIAGEAKHPGVITWDIGSTTAGDISSLYCNRSTAPFRLSRGLKQFGCGIRTPASGVGNDFIMGMSSSVSNFAPGAGIYFECLAADTNWFAVTRAASTETRTDTGVAIAVSTWLDLEVDCRDNANIKFYIDNVLVATNTTNIPTDVGVQLVAMQAYRAQDDDVRLDYWYWDVKAAREY